MPRTTTRRPSYTVRHFLNSRAAYYFGATLMIALPMILAFAYLANSYR